jgi:uncharacterized cupredoxin-like copper-binding protein
MYKVLFPLLALALIGFGVASCGDDDDDDDDAELPEEDGDDDDDDDAEEAESRVNVSLIEYSVTPDPASAAAGDVTFVASNDGAEDHELYIFRTDLAADALPTTDEGAVDEDADGVEKVAEIEEFGPGGEETLTENLEPGNYVLICNRVEEEGDEAEAHYTLGMRAAFTVE